MDDADSQPHLFDVLDWVRAHPLRDGRIIPVCLWGEAGVGKTTMVREWATIRGMHSMTYLPAHDNSGADLRGTEYVNADSGRTHYAAPASLPSRDEAATYEPNGTLIIDEINRGGRGVLNSMFELIGDGRISQSGYELPSGWQIICTANPEDQQYDVVPLDPALKDRMLHLAVGFDVERFARWAEQHGLEADVIAFARDNPHLVAGGHGALPASVMPLPSPRSLEMMAALWDPAAPPRLMRIVAHGLLGEQAGDVFLATATGRARPLTGAQILNGTWRRYLPRWRTHPDGQRLIQCSMAALVVELADSPQPMWQQAAEVFGFACELTGDERSQLLSQLGRRARPWLEMIKTTQGDAFEQLVRADMNQVEAPPVRRAGRALGGDAG